jgi:IS5 family transposase
MYANNTSNGGANNGSIVLMIKCRSAQKWFNLSDPMLEEMRLDRLSFRRFVGLPMDDKTPDETTFVVFRRRLRQHGHLDTLFNATVEILKQSGVILEEGTCVDATIIETSRGGKRDDASTTQKNNRTDHGYKAHIATDTTA